MHRSADQTPACGRHRPPAGPIELLVEGTRDALSCAALLLDLDGVLVESHMVIRRQLSEWATSHGLEARHVLDASHGVTSIDLIVSVAPWLDVADESEAMIQREIDDVCGIRAAPGAIELTSSLPDGRWAVVTSADRRVAHARLAAAGITCPPILVTATDVARGKPDPQGYLMAADALHVAPSDCLVIEDAPAGITAGHLAGCRVIAVEGTVDVAQLAGQLVIPSLEAISVVAQEASS